MKIPLKNIPKLVYFTYMCILTSLVAQLDSVCVWGGGGGTAIYDPFEEIQPFITPPPPLDPPPPPHKAKSSTLLGRPSLAKSKCAERW